METTKKPILESIIDFVFSKNSIKWLIPIFLLGVILRYLFVNNVSFLGDEMVHGPHAINIISTNAIGTMVQSTLWFYLTDLIMKIIGVTAFSTRFLSFFFGTLSILALYLVTKEVFSKKTAVISSFLLAISAFTVRYTLIEMDIAMMFFLLLALYFFIKELKLGKLSYMAAVMIGIAALIKSIALFFTVGFGIAYFYYKYKTAKDKKQILSSEDWKQGIKFTLLILLLFSPILIYNFLLYNDKGVVDVMFAKFFDINKDVYAGQLGFDEGFSPINMMVGAWSMIKYSLFGLDPILFILGILGIILIYINKEERIYKNILVIIMVIPFLIQSGSALLTTHFVAYMTILCIFAASTLTFIKEKTKKYYKNILPLMLLIILIANIFFIPIGSPISKYLTSKSANIQMRDYARENIEDNAIVFVDSRIYRGRIAWMFNDKYYIESGYIADFNNNLNNLAGKETETPVYYIECARDDCGWGTITDGELNKTSEEILNFFKSKSQLVTTFKGGGNYDEKTGETYFNVYKMIILSKPAIYNYITSTHDWFYYPMNYYKDSYDKYQIHNFFYRILDILGHIILYFSIFFSLFTPFYLIYLLKKDKSGKEEDSGTNINLKNINLKKLLIGIFMIVIIFISGATYLHYSHKTMMSDHCNSLNLELDHYSNGELYCLNQTNNAYRAFYYIGKGLNYEITREMPLHDEWKAGAK
ncbi:MAG: glycosyltransferase family 39 protein [Candidatus Nanoarchaeia archaeon]